MSKDRVLLVEFKFHQEIIPSQIMFLKNFGYEVHLIIDESVWDDELFFGIDGFFKTLVSGSKKWYVKICLAVKILCYVRRHNIKYIVFNTLDSTFNNFLIRIIPNIFKVGIVHQAASIANKKAYRNNVYRMDYLLTLSEHTKNYLVNNYSGIPPVFSFYPIFFPFSALPDAQGEIKIVIPGQISYKRRDYDFLISACRELKDKGLIASGDLRFFLLGNIDKDDGAEVLGKIKALGLDDFFWFGHGRVPYAYFLSCISECDYVMPLLSERVGNYRQYLESQVSASFNWGFAFHKKMLVDENFSGIKYVEENSLFYTNSLVSVLPELLAGRSRDYSQPEDLGFDVQSSSYVKAFGEAENL